MDIDVASARSFLATHGRVVDRRRLDLVLGLGGPTEVITTLGAYRNNDGGYGWGLEPDLRASESQPAAAMHALEVLAEVAQEVPDVTTEALALCDWLDDHTLADGGLPFALPVADPAGCSPFWVQADPLASSLQMTTQVVANALAVAHHLPAVAEHPWLAPATAYCADAMRQLDHVPHAYELLFALRFLDSVGDAVTDADSLIERLSHYLPAEGPLPVEGGADGEVLHPLDFAPKAGAVRDLFSNDVIAADFDRLARLQQSDGGWPVGFDPASPAAALEWRGYATVSAVMILRSR